MKRQLLFLLLLICSVRTIAQQETGIVIQKTGSQITINSSNAQHPVVTKTTSSGESAGHDTTLRYTVWLEPGNGFFSTDPSVPAPLSGTQSHIPFLLSTKLYDTTKDLMIKPSGIVYENMSLENNPGSNSFFQYLSDGGVKIIPNAYDIVPGDTMAFAIIYKTYFKSNPVSNVGPFKLYFFYNNNTSFNTLTSNGSFGPTNAAINFCRTHNGETPTFPSPPAGLGKDMNEETYANSICFTIPASSDLEKNVFVSLVPRNDLEYGKSGSVYAVLVDAEGNVLGTDIIPNMRFAPAHDPNYIIQRPVCLKLPKKEYPFTYTVHFQNTGGGDATEVKVVAHLPKGMNWATFDPIRNVQKVSFAGKDFKNTVKITPDKSNDQLIIIFKGIPGNYLKGTNIENPATNPKTMGEITFTIKSTPNTDDTMEAYAEIYFRSEYPSSTAVGGYELPVKTNISITKYKTCCEKGCEKLTPHCHKILGLCWWWWVIILVVILLTCWFIIARKKKKAKQDKTGTSAYN